MANLQYLRFENFFVLLATQGRHRFFEEEAKSIRDVRESPLKFAGYSISYRGGHAPVRIEQNVFNELKAYLVEHSLHRSRATLERSFSKLDFAAYAPVRSQLLALLRAVNARRRSAGYEPLSPTCLRLRRRNVRPFDHGDERESQKPAARQPLRDEINIPRAGEWSSRSGRLP